MKWEISLICTPHWKVTVDGLITKVNNCTADTIDRQSTGMSADSGYCGQWTVTESKLSSVFCLHFNTSIMADLIQQTPSIMITNVGLAGTSEKFICHDKIFKTYVWRAETLGRQKVHVSHRTVRKAKTNRPYRSFVHLIKSLLMSKYVE